MKKLLLLGAAALMSIASASAATVYWDNTGTGWDNVFAYSWSPDVLTELQSTTIDGHTLYSVDLTNEYVIFRGSKTQWANDLQTANLPVVDGAVYGNASRKSVSGSIDPIANIVDGQYVPLTAPEPDTYPEMYLVGDVTSWSKNANYKMSTTDGIVYTLDNVTIAASKQFKFYGGSWGTRELTSATTVNAGSTTELATGSGNIKAGTGIDGVTMTLTVNADYTAGTLVISGESGDDPNPPTPPTPTDFTGWYLNVQGDFNNWKPSGVPFNEDGSVTATNLAIGAGEFELKIWDGTEDSYWGTSEAVEIGVPVEVTNGGGHMTITGAEEGDVFDVAFDYPTGTMTVTKVGGGDDPNPPTPPTPEYKELYLVGDTPGWIDINENYHFEREGNVYTLTLPETISGTWKIWDGTWDYNFGCGAEQPTFGIAYETWFDGGNFTVGIDKDGVIRLTLVAGSDAKNSSIPSELMITGTTGVDSLEAFEGEAVYYNLLGARVLNPTNGVFVRVANGKAVKVVK